jgi:hypothetical protein
VKQEVMPQKAVKQEGSPVKQEGSPVKQEGSPVKQETVKQDRAMSDSPPAKRMKTPPHPSNPQPDKPECRVIIHNIGKKANVGNITR